MDHSLIEREEAKVEPWCSQIRLFPNDLINYSGILWVTNDGSWCLDVVLGLCRDCNDDLKLVTHELRPEEDNRGWNLNGVFLHISCFVH